MLNSDEEVRQRYADLLPNEKVKKELLSFLQSDMAKAKDRLNELLGSNLAERPEAQFDNVERRGNALRTLNQFQVDRLAAYRESSEKEQ